MHIYIYIYIYKYILDEIDQTSVGDSIFNGVMGNTILMHQRKMAEFNSSATFIS